MTRGDPVDGSRRDALRSIALAGAATLLPACRDDDSMRIDDVAQVERTHARSITVPGRTRAIARALADSSGPVSIGGGRYSMGGQIIAAGSLHIDMRQLRGLVSLDRVRRVARVQAGMRWRDLQDHLDPHDLAVAVMQSYSNFTVGGSVSVNCHGRYVGAGPIAHTIRALELVDATGRVHELSRTQNPDLFAAVIGGYGALGVITEVELDLARNTRMRREATRMALADYPAFFGQHVQRPGVVMHNADLAPPAFDAPLAISWIETDEPLTEARRLVPRGRDYAKEQNLIWSASELPGGDELRGRFMDDRVLREHPVVWRNHEASLDAASLESRARAMSTYLLQEYFIPVDAFADFARAMASTLRDAAVSALNVSIRHSPVDSTSLLRWAPREVFSFVLYHKQRNTLAADAASAQWTRRLVDAALDHGGRHYLPYRLHATPAQVLRAYPELHALAAIKRRIDPDARFRNKLVDRYLPGLALTT